MTTWSLPNGAFELTGEGGGGMPNFAKSLQEGFKARYAPEMAQAQIQKARADAMKSQMLAKIFGSVLGAPQMGGGEGDQSSGMQGGMGQGSNPLGITPQALAKGLLHIDPYLQSPKQIADMKTQQQLETKAGKVNIDTGAANVAREYLQKNVSYPKEYMGAGGSLAMAKDVADYSANKNPAAAKRLATAAASEMFVPEYAGFQLQSQGQKTTVPGMHHQQEGTIRRGRPYISNLLTNNLPREVQEMATQLHGKHAAEINRIRENFYSKGGRSQHAPPTKSPGPDTRTITWDAINKTAKGRNMSPNQVIDRLAKEHGMPVDDFMRNFVQTGE